MLVEGEKGEPELFTHLYNLYGVNNIQIIAYKTNLYALYHRLKNDYSNQNGNIEYKFIDLPLFLNDYFNFEGTNRLSKNDFQDILLIFDYDPQDGSYTREKLIEMITNFSSSTDIGKLYINYPMLESYKDINNIDDESFFQSTVHLDEIQRETNGKNKYKRLVISRTCVPDIRGVDKTTSNKILNLHQKKLEKLIGEELAIDQKYIKFSEIQCSKFEQENLIWILNTSLIHFLDEYGELK